MPDSGCKSTIAIGNWHSPEVHSSYRGLQLQRSSVAERFRESLLELGRSNRPWLADKRDKGVEKKEKTVGFFSPKAYYLREVARWIH